MSNFRELFEVVKPTSTYVIFLKGTNVCNNSNMDVIDKEYKKLLKINNKEDIKVISYSKKDEEDITKYMN